MYVLQLSKTKLPQTDSCYEMQADSIFFSIRTTQAVDVELFKGAVTEIWVKMLYFFEFFLLAKIYP